MVVMLIGCGGGGGVPSDGPESAADAWPGPDLTRCATWAATPSQPLTSASADSQLFPRIGWIGDGYALVWSVEATGRSIYTELAPDGSRVGNEVAVTNESANTYTPVSAWSGTELGVAWADLRDGNFEIYAARFGRDGSKLGADVNVSRSTTGSKHPTIAPAPDGWVISWVEAREGPINDEIQLARLSITGAPIGAPVWVTDASGPSTGPKAASGGGDVRIAWTEQQVSPAEIWLASASAPAGGASLTPGSGASIAWGDGGWGVAYTGQRASGLSMLFARVDASGALLGETVVSTGGGLVLQGEVAWAGSAWVVVWLENLSPDADRIMARRVGIDGIAIGDAIVVAETPRFDVPRIAAGGRDLAVVWPSAPPNPPTPSELAFASIVCSP